MIPPKATNVTDRHGGFTAITTKRGDTLWRPGKLLKTSMGALVSYNQNSFYQSNNDVTMAIYKVRGYPYKVALWFDNKSGERIA